MKTKISISFLLILCLTTPCLSQKEQDEEYQIPSNAHTKAIEALKRLGSERGAIPVSYKMVDIIGVVSGISFDMKEVKKNLKDLNAQISDSHIKIDLSGDVLFDFNEWNIRKDAEKELIKIMKIIRAYKSTEIEIYGHTDSKGDEDYNMKLSLNRAQAVKDWFLKNSSISISTIKTIGYGEKKPVAPNTHKNGSDNPEGRQQNRRVEFLIKIQK